MLTMTNSVHQSATPVDAMAYLRPATDPPARAACTPLALQGVLDRLDVGVIICDALGRVLHANAIARVELTRGGPLGLGAGHALEARGSGAAHELRRAVQAAVTAQRYQMLALKHERQLLLMSVQPMSAPDQPVPCALLLLGRRRCADLAVQALGRMFRLTPAEQDILKGLLGGDRVTDLARARGVMLSTVRTQVSALRGKFGVRRLEDILRLAGDLPPMLGAMPALQVAWR